MLVSVIVITYNSAQYVLQTLESIKRQTYKNIELIVSDDRSSDNTISICKDWVIENKHIFRNVKVLQTPSNGGICHNYNYALQQANGEWIKYIAGDDILEDNCIERFVANIKPNIFLYTCITKHLQNETGEIALYSTRIPDESAWKQARSMLKYLYCINGPTIFIERKHLIETGGFEEKYPMIEDWPIAIRYTTSGMRIGIVDEPLVQWRIYGNSISHSNHSFAISLREAWYDYTMRFCWKYFLPLHLYHHWLNHWLLKHSKGGAFIKIFGYVLRCVDFVNVKRKIIPFNNEPYRLVKQSEL
ncbi:MAG: glycosyltransferase [Bacteroidales bacterium]|nr:glycosyltransferase [Bacteroidales bacterium]